jgi:hypothetical protein
MLPWWLLTCLGAVLIGLGLSVGGLSTEVRLMLALAGDALAFWAGRQMQRVFKQWQGAGS